MQVSFFPSDFVEFSGRVTGVAFGETDGAACGVELRS